MTQFAGENPVSASHVDGAPGGNTGGPVGFFSRLRSEHGQGVVEFAMVLVPLVVTVLVLIALGRAVYYYIQVTHVVNEGARIAAVSQATMPNQPGVTPATPFDSISSYLCAQLPGGLDGGPGSATVDVTYPDAQDVGDPVTVGVSADYHWAPFFSFTIHSSATMRIENPPSATGASYPASDVCPAT